MYILFTKAKFNCLLFVEIDQHAVTKFLICIWGEFFTKPNVTISSFQRSQNRSVNYGYQRWGE